MAVTATLKTGPGEPLKRGRSTMTATQASASDRLRDPGISFILTNRYRFPALSGISGMLYTTPRRLSPTRAIKVPNPVMKLKIREMLSATDPMRINKPLYCF